MRSALLQPRTAARLFATLLCLGLALTAQAGKQERMVESSLLISGHITISADGKVLSHRLDDAETLPEGIAALTAHLASKWTFEPAPLGDAKASRSRMRLLYVARRQDDGKVALELRSANFGADLPKEARVRLARKSTQIQYPRALQQNNVSGTVYLKIRVGRDGKVMNIDASHVNLRTIGGENKMALWRNLLSSASVKAVSSWTFQPPTTGPDVDAPHWTGIMPVSFNAYAELDPQPGKWESYIPGPRKVIPWADSQGLTADQTDALTPNEFHSPGNSRRLTSPLMGG
ncbi:MAG: hypothetical protein JNM58_16335 [Xanthomonadaceae bacterium]|nr:hypothetical protein [Xanthomonadaceae bacterium]